MLEFRNKYDCNDIQFELLSFSDVIYYANTKVNMIMYICAFAYCTHTYTGKSNIYENIMDNNYLREIFIKTLKVV